MFVSLLLLVFQAIAPQVGQPASRELPVQMGFRVTPDTVVIGQPFTLFIKVLAPKGVRFELPGEMTGIGPEKRDRWHRRP